MSANECWPMQRKKPNGSRTNTSGPNISSWAFCAKSIVSLLKFCTNEGCGWHRYAKNLRAAATLPSSKRALQFAGISQPSQSIRPQQAPISRLTTHSLDIHPLKCPLPLVKEWSPSSSRVTNLGKESYGYCPAANRLYRLNWNNCRSE